MHSSDRKLWLCVVVPIALLLAGCGDDDDGGFETFREPPAIRSQNGVLNADFTASIVDKKIGGVETVARLYNGLYAPPTLFVRPGDTIRLNLTNEIDGNTNLHYHGMNVSPIVPGDNVFLTVQPGETFNYEIFVPDSHPEGMFYYHPHFHGLTEFQIGSGMSGGIVVEGLLDPFPDLANIKQRVILLKDIQIVNGMVPDPPDSSMPTMRTVNGEVNPVIGIAPGELQLWRVGNVGTDIYYNLEIEGHTMYEIARDGNLHNQLVARDSIFLPVAARTEFLVRGGDVGAYDFRTTAIDMGPQGDQYPATIEATLIVDGPPVTPLPLPSDFPPVQDLRDLPVCCQRSFDFSESSNGSEFCINNTQFDATFINTNVQLGCVEEWTVSNCTGENHVFHIHQLDFQVVEVNGEPVDFIGHQDTVNMPVRVADAQNPARCACVDGFCVDCTCPTDADPQGSVKVLIPFTNPIIEGQFVYHCHIGEHEDTGMMQAINVEPENGACEAGSPSSVDRTALTPRERAMCDF